MFSHGPEWVFALKAPAKLFSLFSLLANHSSGTGRAARRAGWDSTEDSCVLQVVSSFLMRRRVFGVRGVGSRASSAARRPPFAFKNNIQAAARGMSEAPRPTPRTPETVRELSKAPENRESIPDPMPARPRPRLSRHDLMMDSSGPEQKNFDGALQRGCLLRP